jgi:hypothetical protein
MKKSIRKTGRKVGMWMGPCLDPVLRQVFGMEESDLGRLAEIWLLVLDYVILPHFPRDLSIWSFPSFSSVKFQNFPGISGLLSEASQVSEP